jgi:hypothetical protein
MDRQLLERLYRGARANPNRVFQRAVSDGPIDTDTYDFLLEHVAELDMDVLLEFLASEATPDVNIRQRPFLHRLAELLSTQTDGNHGHLLRILSLAKRIDPEAWIEDLTVPLAGRIPNYQWYRLVDKARGGALFDALNTGMQRNEKDSGWDPDESFWPPFEEARTEPVVARVLDLAHNDIAMAAFALETQPVGVLLQLQQRFPDLIHVAAIERILPERVARRAESWVSRGGADELPSWISRWVPQRLELCDEEEARVLYDWFVFQPRPDVAADPFKLAMLRFKLAVSSTPADPRKPPWRYWQPRIAAHLLTGAAWKSRGRELIAPCIELGKGFPPQILEASLESPPSADDGARAKRQKAILRRIHDETARLLVEYAERALIAGELERGDLFLSAFLSLDPGSFIRGAVHHLGKLPGLTPELIARVDACKALAGAGHRDPTKGAFLEAFLVLTGQVP